MKNKVFRKSILILLVISLLLPIMSLFMISASASTTNEYYVGYSQGISLENLHNLTNSSKNSDGTYTNTVSTNSPQITVLIHGLGGAASDWSNDFSTSGNNLQFAYNGKSLVEKLRRNTDGVVYRAETNFDYYNDQKDENGNPIREGSALSGYEQFKLSKCTANCTCNQPDCECVLPYNQEIVTSITDISSHIILIYEPLDQYRNLSEFDISSSSNARVYNELNYVIDKIVYDVKQLNGGILPRINLIGHSRGGLTAMQYALDHPWLVDSLVTMGTPFAGTTLGIEPLLNMLYMSADNSNEHFSFGTKDILDSNVYNSYREKWNDEYEEKYSHINFHAIAGLTTPNGISEILKDPAPPLNEYINMAFTLIDKISEEGVLAGVYPNYNTEIAALGDIFVHLSSQAATEYTGVEQYIRAFQPENMDLSMRTRSLTPIPHNLEPGDAEIHNYIISTIDTGEGDYHKVQKNDGTYKITGINPTAIATPFSIPTHLDGVPVTEIGSRAFYGIESITDVIIPSSITAIGSEAFADCESLSSVSFADSPTITLIGDRAFQNTNLTAFNFPTSLTSIGNFAFANCKLSSVTLGANVSNIGYGAFIDCPISAYSINSANTHYSTLADVIYTNDLKTIVAYPKQKTDATVTLSNVQNIANYAFYGNTYITKVELPAIKKIEDYAFSECTNLAEVTLNNTIQSVGFDAFSNTAFEREDDFLDYGTILIKYNGTAEELVLNDYTRLLPTALGANPNVKTLYLGGKIQKLDENAIMACRSLEKIYLTTDTNVTIAKDSFSYNFELDTIYVSQNRIENYRKSSTWSAYKDLLEVPLTTISFNSSGGTEINTTKTILYYDKLGELPIPSKSGNIFNGWYYTLNGKKTYVDSSSTWSVIADNITFYADWIPRSNSITFYTDGGTLSGYTAIENGLEYRGSYTSSQILILPTPVKEGYTFKGWKDDSDSSVSLILPGTLGDKQYYAQWQSKTYDVTLDFNYINAPNDQESLKTYGTNSNFPVYTTEGLVLSTWRYSGVAYSYGNGLSLYKWNIPNDATLYAEYACKYVTIKVMPISTNPIKLKVTENVILPTGKMLSCKEKIFENTDKIFSYFSTYLARYGMKMNGYTLKMNGSSINISSFNNPDFLSNYVNKAITLTITPNRVVKSYQARFKMGDGYTESSYNVGSIISFPAAPAKEGYKFVYWRLVYDSNTTDACVNDRFNMNGKTDIYRMPDLYEGTVNLSRYLYFEPVYIKKTTKIVYSTGTTAVSVGNTYIYYNESQYLFPKIDVDGYNFYGWYDSNGKYYSDADGVMTVDSWDKQSDSVTLYADLELIQYTINYVLPKDATHTNSYSQYTVEDTINLTDAIKAHCNFMGWYKEAGFINKLTAIEPGMTENLTLHAKFEKINYRVEFIDENQNSIVLYGPKDAEITVPAHNGVYKDGAYYYYNGNKVLESGASYEIIGNETFRSRERTLGECYYDDAYHIYHYEHFNMIRNPSYSGKTFKLMDDIEFSGVWTPFPAFNGTLDGQGYTLNNANINISGGSSGSYGLFTTNSGTITNLTIQGFTVNITASTSTDYLFVGALVGTNSGTVSVINAHNITLNTNKSASRIGGIVGHNTNICSDLVVSSADLSGVGDIGGVIGSTNGGTVDLCFVYGDSVTISVNGTNRYAGGIISFAYGNAIITRCYVSGVDFIFDTYVNIDSDNLWPWIGYVIGYLQNSTLDTVGVSGCTMDYGDLPAEYWDWFTHHDPRANVLNGPNGIYGHSENGNVTNTGWNGVV